MRERRAKPVFIAQDGGGGARPYCRICHCYHVIIDMKYRCPQCGSASDEQGMLNADRKILIAKDVSEPTISNKKPEKAKRDSDLPHGAVWVNPDN